MSNDPSPVGANAARLRHGESPTSLGPDNGKHVPSFEATFRFKCVGCAHALQRLCTYLETYGPPPDFKLVDPHRHNWHSMIIAMIRTRAFLFLLISHYFATVKGALWLGPPGPPTGIPDLYEAKCLTPEDVHHGLHISWTQPPGLQDCQELFNSIPRNATEAASNIFLPKQTNVRSCSMMIKEIHEQRINYQVPGPEISWRSLRSAVQLLLGTCFSVERKPPSMMGVTSIHSRIDLSEKALVIITHPDMIALHSRSHRIW